MPNIVFIVAAGLALLVAVGVAVLLFGRDGGSYRRDD